MRSSNPPRPSGWGWTVPGFSGRLRTARRWLRRIERESTSVAELTDIDLHSAGLSLRYQARCGADNSTLLPRTFALVREVASRQLGMRPFDVQMLGGILLASGTAIEMATGEGKTLTATLPLCLHALRGKGAHLVTANDYLARRDADWMRPLFEGIGLTVGVVEGDSSPTERRAAYRCDITYGTAREFGFDFLRDRLTIRERPTSHVPAVESIDELVAAQRHDDSLQRGLYFALIDEADSVLIDEARTPLVISRPSPQPSSAAEAAFRWAARIAPTMSEGEHYTREPVTKVLRLTTAGQHAVRNLHKPESLASFRLTEIFLAVERAIRVRIDFQRDREYVVRDGEIVIVDEFTGRLGQGRKWRSGLHQAIEAAEGVEVTAETEHAARITVQQYFALYECLAGMSGTLRQSRRELSRTYSLDYATVPTNRPSQRQHLPDRIFELEAAKWTAIVDEVKSLQATGRPVLIGTRSIDKSEHLSSLLTASGVAHQVLHARHEGSEAQRIARAGGRGQVTVATNMAGRGTDILLAEDVRELGGLHVICTELHESARIDAQLVGRAGRQGDPGSCRQYLSLEDEILSAAFGVDDARTVRESAKGGRSLDRFRSVFKTAQALIERRHTRERRKMQKEAAKESQRLMRLGLDPFIDTVDDDPI